MAVDLGDLYRLAFTLTSPDDTPVSADTMTLTITLPDATTAGPFTVAPQSAGQYQYDYLTTQAGRHLARWVGTGTNPGAYSEAFDVLPVAPPYMISLADAKQQLTITSTTADDELRRYLGATTGVIEEHLGQAVVRRSFTEEHSARSGSFVLNWTPAVSLISVARVDGTHTWDVSTLHVSPSGVVTSPLGEAPYGDITVTYVAGMAVIPENNLLAAQVILQHLWDTQRGSKGGPHTGGMADSMQLGTGHMGYAIPNRAIELLGAGLPGIA